MHEYVNYLYFKYFTINYITLTVKDTLGVLRGSSVFFEFKEFWFEPT